VLPVPPEIEGRDGGLGIAVALADLVAGTSIIGVPSDEVAVSAGEVGAIDRMTSAPASETVTRPSAPKPIHTARGIVGFEGRRAMSWEVEGFTGFPVVG
jgi:hypothetical protein